MSDDEGKKQLLWRADAAQSGDAGGAGDIGSHLIFQTYFVTGLPIVAVKNAAREFLVQGKTHKNEAGEDVQSTDDRASCMLVLEGGVNIQLHVCQWAEGRGNNNRTEFWSDVGTFSWNLSENTEYLWHIITKLVIGDFDSPLLIATDPMPTVHGDGWADAQARLIQWFLWNRSEQLPAGVEPFILDFLLGYNVNLVLDAIVKSANQDGATVEVPWVSDWKDL